jgi:hypothetical protein
MLLRNVGTHLLNRMASVTKVSPLHSHLCEGFFSNRMIISYKQDGKFAYKPNTEASSCDHCCSGKAISITYSECVFVALGIQHAMRKHRIILSSMACLAVPDFYTLSHKRSLLNKMCVVIFSITVVCSISHSKKTAVRCYHKGR